MVPVKYQLPVCWQGKTYEKPLIFRDRFGQEINLGGYSARMQVRASVDAANFLVNLTTENGGIVIDAPQGEVLLFISASDTAGLIPGSFKYDLELVSASGRVYCPIYGSFKVKPEVTR